MKQSLLTKKNLSLVLIFCILLVFRDVVFNQINRFITVPWLSRVSSGFANDVLIGLFAGAIIIFFLRKLIQRYHVSASLGLVSILVFLLYILVRFCNPVMSGHGWLLTSFKCCGFIKYTDVVAIIPLGYIVLTIVFWTHYYYDKNISKGSDTPNVIKKWCEKIFPLKKESVIKRDTEKQLEDRDNRVTDFSDLKLIVDDPIEKAEEDVLNWGDQLEQITSLIHKTESKSAVAFGIVGEWGSGKTSFVNLLKKKLADENTVIVEFNPWMVTKGGNLVEDFFDVLKTKLGKYSSTISNQLSTYSRHLLSLDKNMLTKLIDISVNLFEGTDNRSRFEGINKTLRLIKKDVVVIIDDMDRLDKKEILEVLKLIRNTANFNQFKYIVPYSKAYLVEAVKEINPHNSERYIDKIFLFNYKLLPPKNKNLKEVAEKSLIMAGFSYVEIEIVKDHLFGISSIGLFLPLFRDVKRFLNQTIIDYNFVRNHLDFSDFLMITILDYRYPDVYKLLVDNRIKIFSSGTQDGGLNYYYVLIKESDKVDGEQYPFEKLLDELIKINGLDSSVKKKVLKLVESLFETDILGFKKHRRIAHTQQFDRYFTSTLEENYVNEELLYVHLVKKDAGLYLEQLIDEGKSNSVNRHLDDFKFDKIETKDDFENVIIGLLYYLNVLYKKKESALYAVEYSTSVRVFNNIISKYRSNDEQTKIDNFVEGTVPRYPVDVILSKYYNRNYDEYMNFLRPLFAGKTFKTFEYSFIYHKFKEKIGDRPYNQIECFDILMNTFSDHTDRDDKDFDWLDIISEYLNIVYWSSADSKFTKKRASQIDNLFNGMISDNLEPFLQFIIHKWTKKDYKSMVFYSIDEEIKKCFDEEWGYLETLLEDNLIDYVKRFKVFYEKLKENDYEPVSGDYNDLLKPEDKGLFDETEEE